MVSTIFYGLLRGNYFQIPTAHYNRRLFASLRQYWWFAVFLTSLNSREKACLVPTIQIQFGPDPVNCAALSITSLVLHPLIKPA